MTDIAITADSVLGSGSATRATGTAGEAITAGQIVYFDTTVNKWKLADADSATAAVNHAEGVALNGAALNQPVTVQKDGDVTIGGTLTAGSPYYLSGTPGGIAPAADLTTGDKVCLLGLAKSTTVLTLDIQFPGVTL
ncbi:MAG: hypothetical protein NTAFB05_25800 [Nitrobacter sp.]|uniref:hypothetical protein n=1 Tax=Nitrobacter sp. TaxID=29420 RepID=UPI00387DF2DD